MHVREIRKMRGKFLGFESSYHPITYVHIHHNMKYIARYRIEGYFRLVYIFAVRLKRQN